MEKQTNKQEDKKIFIENVDMMIENEKLYKWILKLGVAKAIA